MDLCICLWDGSGSGSCWIFPKECASRVCCIILQCKHEDCHINFFQSPHNSFENLQTFRKQNRGPDFFFFFSPLFPRLQVTLDLQKSQKLGLTGRLDRFIAALYPCNSRYQAKHGQIWAWGSKHYSKYRGNLLNVARFRLQTAWNCHVARFTLFLSSQWKKLLIHKSNLAEY